MAKEKRIQWIEQACKTNMSLLIDIIELKVKENGMADRANELPNMERVAIAHIFLAMSGFGIECLGGVRNQIDWALNIQAEETLQNGSIRLTMYYRMKLLQRGVRVNIGEFEREHRKNTVCKYRKENKEE